jgi:hypothetical protein
MNGATAVPFVSTISPPNMAMTMNTGSSQYFLRSSKNAANSRRKEAIGHSELVHEAVGRRAWRLSRDPVAFALRLEAKPQRVFSTEPHEPADWRNAAIVHDPQRERAHDREQDEAQLTWRCGGITRTSSSRIEHYESRAMRADVPARLPASYRSPTQFEP